MNKAQVILNVAARWVLGRSKKTRVMELMEQTGWFTVRELVRISTIILVWKLVYMGKPSRLL